MSQVKKILFPVDLSEASIKIAPYVIEFADRFQAEVHLLFVGRILNYFSTLYVEPSLISKMEESIREGAEKRLREFRLTHLSSISTVLTKVVIGYAPEEIIGYVGAQQIDLIIMGTHGRSGLEKVIFGSVAEQVVRTAGIPVTVINPVRTENRT